MKPNWKVSWGLVLIGLVIAWAIVSGEGHNFFPISQIAMWLYFGPLDSLKLPWQVAQLAVELVPTLIFFAGAYQAVFYSGEWKNRAYPLLLALTATLLAQALYNLIFPLAGWSA